jgi:hypothetical protein
MYSGCLTNPVLASLHRLQLHCTLDLPGCPVLFVELFLQVRKNKVSIVELLSSTITTRARLKFHEVIGACSLDSVTNRRPRLAATAIIQAT